MSTATTNGTTAAKAAKPNPVAGIATWADDRTGLAGLARKQIRKVFPDHWSFMLGEIALWSFVVLLLTGTLLTLWFKPSMGEVVYNGTYDQLRGVSMSEAYASTLDISFDVRGGLLLRQMHHWAAMLFIASMLVHLMRVYFTGAFRKPRELNWVIGSTLLLLGTLEGFTGYSLPDDLLSGTGIRAADGFMKSIPVIGTYVSFFVFDGEFPGDAIIPRLYTAHVLLIPGILLALIGAHMLLLVFHKHTQWPGPGRTNDNVVGYPLLPVYTAKAGGFFFVVFGFTALMGGLLTLNPVWRFGPYDPSQVTAGSQPDWYMGWLEGAVRLLPGWLEFSVFGWTFSFNIAIGGLILPGIVTMLMYAYPFLEAWVTGDKREHHLLDRPRNAPTRTGLGVMAITFYCLCWAGGGNDIIATHFHLSINDITNTLRVGVIVIPPIAFLVAKRVCLGLQRHDRELVLHGIESGRVVRMPSGEYLEVHEPLDEFERWELVQHDTHRPLPEPVAADESGVRRPGLRAARIRAKLSHFWFEDRIEPVTPEELEAAHAHGEHDALGTAHGQPSLESGTGSPTQDTETTSAAVNRH
jgi:ubiquinol-cytochrome c reductase cytochrome b subunit